LLLKINYKLINQIIFLTAFEAIAAFTFNGFDNQERNLMFVKTDFQVLKLNFHACNFK